MAKEKVLGPAEHCADDDDDGGGNGGGDGRRWKERKRGERKRRRERGEGRVLPSVDLCVAAWSTWRLALRKIRLDTVLDWCKRRRQDHQWIYATLICWTEFEKRCMDAYLQKNPYHIKAPTISKHVSCLALQSQLKSLSIKVEVTVRNFGAVSRNCSTLRGR
ncbi:hypothetical protein EAG_12182 [Camponotus floridanus]|uniref:Uncharacterized protein n=1 Tax=Camponotus floridanus TaxID=104421 RepID=E2AZY5_CAMFO|nr:hypothetical protein EAG_12182 [Camponotus floridanus]